MATVKRSGLKDATRVEMHDEPLAVVAARASRQQEVDRYQKLEAASPVAQKAYTIESTLAVLNSELQQLQQEMILLDHKLDPIMDPNRRKGPSKCEGEQCADGSMLRQQVEVAIRLVQAMREHAKDMFSGADLAELKDRAAIEGTRC